MRCRPQFYFGDGDVEVSRGPELSLTEAFAGSLAPLTLQAQWSQWLKAGVPCALWIGCRLMLRSSAYKWTWRWVSLTTEKNQNMLYCIVNIL